MYRILNRGVPRAGTCLPLNAASPRKKTKCTWNIKLTKNTTYNKFTHFPFKEQLSFFTPHWTIQDWGKGLMPAVPSRVHAPDSRCSNDSCWWYWSECRPRPRWVHCRPWPRCRPRSCCPGRSCRCSPAHWTHNGAISKSITDKTVLNIWIYWIILTN